ncbi:MAG: rhodanese-like domain-containing protein [Gammaproteobacteria bacterium]
MPVRSLSPLEFQTRRLLQRIKLIDVRDPAEYQAGHIPGALSVPLNSLSAATLIAEAGTIDPRKDTVLLSCQSGIRAQQAAEKLVDMGYQQVAVLDGGLDQWMKSRLPVRRCGHAFSVQRQVQLVLGVLIVALITLGAIVHPAFHIGAGLLGLGLISAGLTNWCGLAQLINSMPWNQPRPCSQGIPS